MKLASVRTHSWYSLMEGVNSPRQLAEAAAQEGYHALALTDTNSLAGAVDVGQVVSEEEFDLIRREAHQSRAALDEGEGADGGGVGHFLAFLAGGRAG